LIKLKNVVTLQITGRKSGTLPVTAMHKADGVHLFISRTHLRFTGEQWNALVTAMEYIDTGTGITEIDQPSYSSTPRYPHRDGETYGETYGEA
jgi:hypothetical protein